MTSNPITVTRAALNRILFKMNKVTEYDNGTTVYDYDTKLGTITFEVEAESNGSFDVLIFDNKAKTVHQITRTPSIDGDNYVRTGGEPGKIITRLMDEMGLAQVA